MADGYNPISALLLCRNRGDVARRDKPQVGQVACLSKRATRFQSRRECSPKQVSLRLGLAEIEASLWPNCHAHLRNVPRYRWHLQQLEEHASCLVLQRPLWVFERSGKCRLCYLHSNQPRSANFKRGMYEEERVECRAVRRGTQCED